MEENKETRMTIIHKSGSDCTSIYNNNPWADKEDQIQMLKAHMTYFIGSMAKNGASFCAVITAVSEIMQEANSSYERVYMAEHIQRKD